MELAKIFFFLSSIMLCVLLAEMGTENLLTFTQTYSTHFRCLPYGVMGNKYCPY